MSAGPGTVGSAASSSPGRRWRPGALVAAALFSAAAHAQEGACQSSYVATQRLQRAARLREARREAIACGQDSCSETVRADCITWLGDIERALPTLVVDARDANGATIADLRIEAGSELLTEHWDGRALELDPGEYVLRIQHGAQVAEAHTLIREAEKYRTVQVRFDALPGAKPTLAATPPPSAQAPPASPPVVSYVLGGLSLAGMASFALLAASGYSSEQHLRESCAGACRAADVDSVRMRYVLADLSLGVGVTAGIAAAAFWVWQPSDHSTALAIGPGSVRWQGAF